MSFIHHPFSFSTPPVITRGFMPNQSSAYPLMLGASQMIIEQIPWIKSHLIAKTALSE
jgi:hypothetical protein